MSEFTAADILDMIEATGGPERLDLSGQDLSGIDFGGTVLEELRSTPGALQRWPSLQSDRFFGLELWEADLHGADLQGANLEKAILQNANLQSAHLRDANLRGALLVDADLEHAGPRRCQSGGSQPPER